MHMHHIYIYNIIKQKTQTHNQQQIHFTNTKTDQIKHMYFNITQSNQQKQSKQEQNQTTKQQNIHR